MPVMNIRDTRTTVNTAANAGDWTSVKTGGGGTPTFADFPSDPAPVFSTNCVGIPVNIESAGGYVASGTLNFTTNPEIIYAWILPLGVIDTFENGGIHIILSDGTNDIGFHIGGSNKASFRHDNESIGWQCMVLDTSIISSRYTTSNTIPYAGNLASLNLGAITGIGAGATCLAKAKGGNENTFFDVIRRGNDGIVVYDGIPSDPGTFESMSLLDSSNTFAAGVCRRLGSGLYGLQGSVTFGSSSVNTYFEEINSTVVFEDRDVGTDRYTLQFNGTNGATFSSSIILGEKVGTGDTATGRRGVTFLATEVDQQGTLVDPSASFVVSGSTDTFKMYGSTIRGYNGGITMSVETPFGADHEFIGSNVISSQQTDIGYSETRNTTFSDYNFVSGAALLWDSSSIDIKNSNFTNNTFAIEFDANSTDPTYTNIFSGLQFSSNTFDILNSSGGRVTASIAGGGNVPTVFNSGSSTTQIIAQTTVTLTGMVSASEVRVYDQDSGTAIAGTENVGDTGQFQFVYDAADTVYIVVHALNYQYILISDYVIPSSDTELPISQVFDRNYDNPD